MVSWSAALFNLSIVLILIFLISGVIVWLKNSPPLFFKKKLLSPHQLKVVSSLMIDTKRRIIVVRLDNQDYVLFVGAHQEFLIGTHPVLPSPHPSS